MESEIHLLIFFSFLQLVITGALWAFLISALKMLKRFLPKVEEATSTYSDGRIIE